MGFVVCLQLLLFTFCVFVLHYFEEKQQRISVFFF